MYFKKNGLLLITVFIITLPEEFLMVNLPNLPYWKHLKEETRIPVVKYVPVSTSKYVVKYVPVSTSIFISEFLRYKVK